MGYNFNTDALNGDRLVLCWADDSLFLYLFLFRTRNVVASFKQETRSRRLNKKQDMQLRVLNTKQETQLRVLNKKRGHVFLTKYSSTCFEQDLYGNILQTRWSKHVFWVGHTDVLSVLSETGSERSKTRGRVIWGADASYRTRPRIKTRGHVFVSW